MTEIEFHVNVRDKLDFSCRLLRKAHRSGARLVVTAEPALLAQLDQLLWTFSAHDFLPHCSGNAPVHTLAATPILLAEQLQGCPADSVLINLGQHAPAHFERFERFIEVASDASDDILAARVRWKYYKDRGYALKKHDLPTGPEAA
jgi:DNA polymerase-3 subunit chi